MVTWISGGFYKLLDGYLWGGNIGVPKSEVNYVFSTSSFLRLK